MMACICGGVVEIGIVVAIVSFVSGLFTCVVNHKRCPRPCCTKTTRVDEAETPQGGHS
jgi:hypothetical protein